MAGTGEAGCKDGSCDLAQFSEPSGLCVEPGGKSLLVADSNNHMIRIIDLGTSEVSQVSVCIRHEELIRHPPCLLALYMVAAA